MADARWAARATQVAQTAPIDARPRCSPSPAVNTATGPAGNEQRVSPLHPSVASWEKPRDLFLARHAAPASPVVAALPGGSQAPPSSHHVKPFIRQVGTASARQGASRDRPEPQARLAFSSEDHPSNSACSGALPMLCTPTIC